MSAVHGTTLACHRRPGAGRGLTGGASYPWGCRRRAWLDPGLRPRPSPGQAGRRSLGGGGVADPSPLKGERIRRVASLLASRSWRGVAGLVRCASTPLQASLDPGGASFAILSPFRGEGCLVVQALHCRIWSARIGRCRRLPAPPMPTSYRVARPRRALRSLGAHDALAFLQERSADVLHQLALGAAVAARAQSRLVRGPACCLPAPKPKLIAPPPTTS